MDLGKDTCHVITQMGFRRLKLRRQCIRNRRISKCDIPIVIKIVWGHSGVGEWTGGTPYRGFVAISPTSIASGFAILQTPKYQQSEGPLNSQSRDYIGVSAYQESGVGKASCSTSQVVKS
jgi:hypothetical protein